MSNSPFRRVSMHYLQGFAFVVWALPQVSAGSPTSLLTSSDKERCVQQAVEEDSFEDSALHLLQSRAIAKKFAHAIAAQEDEAEVSGEEKMTVASVAKAELRRSSIDKAAARDDATEQKGEIVARQNVTIGAAAVATAAAFEEKMENEKDQVGTQPMPKAGAVALPESKDMSSLGFFQKMMSSSSMKKSEVAVNEAVEMSRSFPHGALVGATIVVTLLAIIESRKELKPGKGKDTCNVDELHVHGGDMAPGATSWSGAPSIWMVQATALAFQILSCMDFATTTPGSIEFLFVLGWERWSFAAVLMIAVVIIVPVGGLLWRIFSPWGYAKVKSAVVITALCAAVCNCSAACLLGLLRKDDPFVLGAVIALRVIACIPIGMGQLLTKCAGLRVTAPQRQVPFCVVYVVCANVGLSLGPLLLVARGQLSTTILSDSLLQTGITQDHAVTFQVIAVLWAILAAVAGLVVPEDVQPMLTVLPQPVTDFTQVAPLWSHSEVKPEQMDRKERQSIMRSCALYSCERLGTGAAIEVVSALVLQTEFGWSLQAIGVTMGLLNAFTIVIGLLSLVVKHILVVETTAYVGVMALVSTSSLAFLFNTTRETAEPQFLTASCIVISCSCVAAGMSDGLTCRAALPDTKFLLESWQVINMTITSLAHLFGAFMGRLVFKYFGHNQYVAWQLLLGLLTMRIVASVAAVLWRRRARKNRAGVDLNMG